MPELPRIAIIIPVHNAKGDIGKCLDAALESVSFYKKNGGFAEILVVDDASDDESAAVARSTGVKVIQLMSPPRGPAFARNRGAENAPEAEALVFADSDVLIKPDTLFKIGGIFVSRPDVHALFGSYDDRPAAPDFISQYKNLFHHYVHQTSMENSSSFWAGCGAIRAAVFRGVGGFPESYSRPAIEDIELGYIMMSRGYRTILVKDLLVTHMKRWTFFNLVRTDVMMRGIPWTVLLLKTRSFTKDLNLQTHNRVSVALVYLILLSVLLSFVWPWMWASVAPLLGFVIYLNWGLYQFFAEKRGYVFALKAFPLHLFYYLYNGVSFWLGVLSYRLSLGASREGS